MNIILASLQDCRNFEQTKLRCSIVERILYKPPKNVLKKVFIIFKGKRVPGFERVASFDFVAWKGQNTCVF